VGGLPWLNPTDVRGVKPKERKIKIKIKIKEIIRFFVEIFF
jgi:hypothetical protein